MRSLVGAERLPPDERLSLEAVQINRGYGDGSQGLLSWELRPDGSLSVTHYGAGRGEAPATERFRLDAATAGRVRRLLRRVRPETLDGIDSHEARPSGCERRGPHDSGELAIVFIDEGRAPGIEDDRLGTFELPRPGSCDTAQAREARQLVRQVMDSLPKSEVASGFES